MFLYFYIYHGILLLLLFLRERGKENTKNSIFKKGKVKIEKL